MNFKYLWFTTMNVCFSGFSQFSYTIVLFIPGFLNIGRWPKGKPRLANFGLMDQVAGT